MNCPECGAAMAMVKIIVDRVLYCNSCGTMASHHGTKTPALVAAVRAAAGKAAKDTTCGWWEIDGLSWADVMRRAGLDTRSEKGE